MGDARLVLFYLFIDGDLYDFIESIFGFSVAMIDFGDRVLACVYADVHVAVAVAKVGARIMRSAFCLLW